jgi:4-amino-4-deoxy-L-arabinose transferase-like glycosyltransferase
MTVSHHRIAQSPALRYLLVFLFAAIAVAPGISASHRLTATSRASRRRPSNAGNRRLCRHPFPARARYQKPVGIYWMQVAAIKAAGYGSDAPIWVYRLVSVLAIAIAAAGWHGQERTCSAAMPG